jgi:hypothetical protein
MRQLPQKLGICFYLTETDSKLLLTLPLWLLCKVEEGAPSAEAAIRHANDCGQIATIAYEHMQAGFLEMIPNMSAGRRHLPTRRLERRAAADSANLILSFSSQAFASASIILRKSAFSTFPAALRGKAASRKVMKSGTL